MVQISMVRLCRDGGMGDEVEGGEVVEGEEGVENQLLIPHS